MSAFGAVLVGEEGVIRCEPRRELMYPSVMAECAKRAKRLSLPIEHEPVRVKADNVSHYLYSVSPKEEWPPESFPCCIPPWPATWIESPPPRHIRSGKRVTTSDIPSQVVCNADLIMRIGPLKSGLGDGVIKANPLIPEGIRSGLTCGDEQAAWCIIANHYMLLRNGRLLQTHRMTDYLTPDGRPIEDAEYIETLIYDEQGWKQIPRQEQEGIIRGGGTAFMVARLTFSLLHCKNVTLEDEPIPKNIGAINRKRKKKGKRELYSIRYKTLVVEPFKKVAAAQGGGSEGVRKALHMCRGHFKDYRDGPGLFGKLHKLYWWDMHMRGDKANGEVRKDYAIK